LFLLRAIASTRLPVSNPINDVIAIPKFASGEWPPPSVQFSFFVYLAPG
jgi:hypothetical protein